MPRDVSGALRIGNAGPDQVRGGEGRFLEKVMTLLCSDRRQGVPGGGAARKRREPVKGNGAFQVPGGVHGAGERRDVRVTE